MEYYDRRCGEGFDFAYRYPGMNKVLQAAGRVIRTAEDAGVIILLDERFLQEAVSKGVGEAGSVQRGYAAGLSGGVLEAAGRGCRCGERITAGHF